MRVNKLISKQMITGLIAAALILQSSVFVAGTSQIIYACTTAEECQNAIAEAQKKRAELAQKQKELESKSADTNTQMENIVAQMNTYQTELTLLDIEMTNLQAQQVQLQKSIQDNNDKIKERLIMTQLSMETDETLQFLANASSITEMIERLQTISDLTESNQDIIKTLEAQKAELAKNEQMQKKRKEQVDQLVAEQVKLKESKKAELDQYLTDAANAAALKEEATKELGVSEQQFAEIEAARKRAEELDRVQREEAKRVAAQQANSQTNTQQSKPVEAIPIPTTPIPSNGTASQNEKAAFNYFIAQGYTREAVAGIIGNFYVESGMDPTKKQYGGGPGRGLAQWGYNADGGRFNSLIIWAHQQGKNEWALNTQLEWTVKEIRSYGMEGVLKSTTDATYATVYFCDVFERPNPYYAHKSARINYAKQVLNRN